MRNSLSGLSLALLFLLPTAPSFAELGGAVTKEAVQIRVEQSTVKAIPGASPSASTNATGNASVNPTGTPPGLHAYQTVLGTGTQIKEYADDSGIVVVVTWQGPTLPNLKQLLGTHFETFVNRPVLPGANRRQAEFTTDDLVVQSHGRLRTFSGIAYLPKLLPAGFNINQLQ